jgi:hypothetical protein
MRALDKWMQLHTTLRGTICDRDWDSLGVLHAYSRSVRALISRSDSSVRLGHRATIFTFDPTFAAYSTSATVSGIKLAHPHRKVPISTAAEHTMDIYNIV